MGVPDSLRSYWTTLSPNYLQCEFCGEVEHRGSWGIVREGDERLYQCLSCHRIRDRDEKVV